MHDDGLDLVTGGSGFIGRHLVRTLLRTGRRVRVLDLAESSPPGAEHARGSVTDPAAVRAACDRADRVFHVAGNPKLWVRDRRRVEAVNTGAVRTVMHAAAAAGVGHVVYTSSDVLTTGRPIGAYAASKAAGEAEALRWVDALRVVVVRPAAPVGPGDENLTPPTQMLRMLLAAPPPAYFDASLSLVDVRDVAEAHAAAADRGRAGTCYAVRAPEVRLGELIERLRPIAARRLPRRRIPYAAALLAALVSDGVVSRVTRREPIATVAGVRLGRPGVRRRDGVPIGELGVALRPTDDAVAEAVRWLVERGLVPADAVQPAALASAGRGAGLP